MKANSETINSIIEENTKKIHFVWLFCKEAYNFNNKNIK